MLNAYVVGILAAVCGADVAEIVDDRVLDAERGRVEVIQRVAPSVVAIFGRTGQGGGSGVLISPDGFALSNFHVTASAGDTMKCGLNDGRLYDAVIVGIDPTGDVALIKLLGRDDFPTAEMGNSDRVRVGDWVYAMGNPFLLATDFQPTVTYGIVSGVHRYQYPAGRNILEYTDCIQIDASINPGNSGGPLFDSEGRLIGINGRGSFDKRGRVNSGAGYAISINQIKHFMDHLKSGRIVDHATLGATVTTTGDGTVVVDQILEESDVFRRGLREGDELVSFAGRPIRSVNQFKNVLGIFPRGWKLPIVFRNEGQQQEVFVRLRALHNASELSPDRPNRRRPKPKDDEKEKSEKEKEDERGLPKEFAHLLVKKDGYANFYFNQQHQKRLLKSLSDYAPVRGDWIASGRTAAGVEFEFVLSDDASAVRWGKERFVEATKEEPEDSPPGTGGLLAAMGQLRRFLTLRERGFTDFFYLGSEPLDGRGESVDVLVSTQLLTEARWYFRKSDQSLIGFDVRRDADVDACEIRIVKTGRIGGRAFPREFDVHFANERVVRISIENVAMNDTPPEAAGQ